MFLRSTVSVEVLRPTVLRYDDLGNPVKGYESETVAGVLITPAETSDIGPERPEGYTASLTVHFPKTYTKSLQGCALSLPAPYPSYVTVEGDPQPYMSELTPGQWNRAAQVVAADG